MAVGRAGVCRAGGRRWDQSRTATGSVAAYLGHSSCPQPSRPRLRRRVLVRPRRDRSTAGPGAKQDPARSWQSPNWRRTSTRIAQRYGRSPRFLVARPGESRPVGWRRSTSWHGCPRAPCHRCTFPTTGHHSLGCGPAKNPGAAARLAAVRMPLCRPSPNDMSCRSENLITPDHLRRLAWRPPTPVTAESVDQALADLGARPWQRELTVATITPLLATPQSDTANSLMPRSRAAVVTDE